jgi:hypothetical protein
VTAPAVAATASAEATLVAQHRVELEALLAFAASDLDVAFGLIDVPDVAREVLQYVLPQLVAVYGSAAATLGADFYDELRAAEGVSGRFRAIPAELPDAGRTDSLAGWGIDPLFRAQPDFESAKSLVGGGLQKTIADMDRGSVIRSIDADKQAGGWKRATTGKSCPFCVMIAGRGFVYSAKTADFSSHDNCDCLAVPKFGLVREVRPYVPSQKFTKPEQRAKNNAAIRRYLGGGSQGGVSRTGERQDEPVDVDAGRTLDQLRATADALERSLAKFDSPGTRRRVEELRAKIAARS